jgi:hypothetical protein
MDPDIVPTGRQKSNTIAESNLAYRPSKATKDFLIKRLGIKPNELRNKELFKCIYESIYTFQLN